MFGLCDRVRIGVPLLAVGIALLIGCGGGGGGGQPSTNSGTTSGNSSAGGTGTTVAVVGTRTSSHFLPAAFNAQNFGVTSLNSMAVSTFFTTHVITQSCRDLKIDWANFAVESAVEHAPLGSIKLTAAIEPTVGNGHPVRILFAGKPSIDISQLATVQSDAIPINFGGGQRVRIRTCISAPFGSTIPWNMQTVTTGSCVDGVTANQDATMSARPANLGQGARCFAPVAMEATANAIVPKATFAIVGDSIGAGSGDDFTFGGYLVRGLTGNPSGSTLGGPNSFGFVNISQPGARLADFSASGVAGTAIRVGIASKAKNAIVELGINDLESGLPAMKQRALALFERLKQGGAKVYACTLTPRAESGNNFKTLSDQFPCGQVVSGVANNAGSLQLLIDPDFPSIAPHVGEQIRVYGVSSVPSGALIAVKSVDVHALTLALPYAKQTSSSVAGWSSPALEAVRTGYNDWLRGIDGSAITDAAGNLDGYIDAVRGVEADVTGALARNGGYWSIKAGAPTKDGVHPNTTGAALLGEQAANGAGYSGVLTPALNIPKIALR